MSNATTFQKQRPFQLRGPQKDEAAKLRAIALQYLQNLAEFAAKQAWRQHAAIALAALRWMRRVHIWNLDVVDDDLIAGINKHGLRPFLAIVVDYGWRLLHQRDSKCMKRYQRLLTAFRKAEFEGKGPSMVIMRSGKSAHRVYSENVGWAVAGMLISSFGERQVAFGYTPETFLRIIALLDSCSKHKEKAGIEGSAQSLLAKQRKVTQAVNTCLILAQGLRTKLGDKAMNDLDGAIADISSSGFYSGLSECVASLAEDTQAAELTRRLEEYTACREALVGDPADRTSWVADGASTDTRGNLNPSSAASSDRSHARWTPDRGWHIVTDKTTRGPSRFGPDTITWEHSEGDGTKTTEGYDTETGIYAKLTEYSDGSSDFEWNDGQGNSGSAHQNHNGTPGNSSQTENLGGGTSQKTDVSRDSNGNTTGTKIEVKTDNGDGTTTTQTFEYDAAGNEVSTDTTTTPTPSTPINEGPIDPCRQHLYDDPRHDGGSDFASKLQALIIPAPDAVEPTDDPCLSGFGNGSPQRCTSVWLCLNGVDENCRCKGSEGRGSLPEDRGACATIMCAEGATCDPQTGVCKSSAGGWEPGIVIPDPPVVPGTAPIISAIFGALSPELIHLNGGIQALMMTDHRAPST